MPGEHLFVTANYFRDDQFTFKQDVEMSCLLAIVRQDLPVLKFLYTSSRGNRSHLVFWAASKQFIILEQLQDAHSVPRITLIL